MLTGLHVFSGLLHFPSDILPERLDHNLVAFKLGCYARTECNRAGGLAVMSQELLKLRNSLLVQGGRVLISDLAAHLRFLKQCLDTGQGVSAGQRFGE
eukprot:scaffold90644_cov40-Prasinocladus_malaysianus.AAC.1